MTTPDGGSSKSLTSFPHIEKRLVGDEQTSELYLPLVSTVVLKRKQQMLCLPLVFDNNLIIDALVDSGSHVSAIAQNDLDTIKQKAPNNFLKIDDPPNFQIPVANGQSEKPLATATLKFDIGDNTFAEHFVLMKKLTGPIIGLHFMRNNSLISHTTNGRIHFPHLTMQIKTTSEMSPKPQAVLTDDALAIASGTTKAVTAFVDHPSEWNTPGTVTPLEKFTETAVLLISFSISPIIDRKVEVRVTNTTETPYLIKRNTQIAQFCVITPEQAKFMKPVDMAILIMIPEADLDVTAYLNELSQIEQTTTAK